MQTLIHKFNIDYRQTLEPQTWVVILVLSILVAIILVGIFTIFVYNHKSVQLYRLQNNFINNFTHELKTPVTSLKLYLETFLKYDLAKEEQEKYLRYMIKDVERLSDNITRILELSRIESKKFKGEFVAVDIVEAVESFSTGFAHLFQNAEIVVHHPDEKDFKYDINPHLFEMLLINLVTNGIKYNRSEQPRIDISFHKNNNRIIARFEDNGIGIEKSEIKKIFKKFYQVGRSDDRSAVGSGLGLYLAQNIARIHKGVLVAESGGLDRGSALVLMFPCKGEAPETE